MAVERRNRFPRIGLIELAAADPELWAQEEPRNCNEERLPKRRVAWNSEGERGECREVTDAAVLPTGYAAIARKIADRRMMLAGYRLADLLQRISNQLSSVSPTCRGVNQI